MNYVLIIWNVNALLTALKWAAIVSVVEKIHMMVS